MTIGEFFQQNGAAIIIASIGALPSCISAIGVIVNNKRSLENRKLAESGREVTDGKVQEVKVAVENGYHAAVAVAADVAATKVIEKAKEVADVLAHNAYTGPERRREDKGPPEDIERRKQE